MGLKHIWQTIKGWFSKELDSEIQEYAGHALRITTTIKSWLDSPIAGALVSIIPSDVDNDLRERLREALDKALPMVTLVNNCSGKTLEEAIECFGNGLLQYSPSVRNAMLFKLASLLTRYAHGGDDKQNLYDLVTQFVYSNIKND